MSIKEKEYQITWEYIQTGISKLKAKDLDDAKDKADNSITDFGDPEQFDQIPQFDDGWKVKSIEEVE